MREILITTESGSDLPQEIIDEYGFYVVPMHVIIDDVSYADGTFPVDDIFAYFERTKKVPTTSAVNVSEYLEFFTKLQEEHPGCVIYNFAYSSVASSTYQNCAIAIRNLKDIYLIDTKSVSGGCTALMVKAWELVEREKKTVTDYAWLAERLQALTDNNVCHFIPATLEYLKAGGRCSNAQYLGATLLNLHPLIEINPDGYLIATKKYRGSMTKIVDKFMADFISRYNLERDCLYLMYGKGLPQEALDRMKENAERYGFKRSVYVMTGSVISCHGGKGAIGLAGNTY